MEALADVDVPDDVAADAIGRTVVIKLNGGLGTSMGMDRAKSLLEVRDGLTLPRRHRPAGAGAARAVRRPPPAAVHEQLPDPRRHPGGAGVATTDLAGRRPAAGLPAEQGAQAPHRRPDPGRAGPPTRPSSGARRGTATSTPRCAAPGCSTRCSTRGSPRCSCPTPTTSARCPTPGSPAGSPSSGAPFAIEAVRRTPSDRKGGHFARREDRRPDRAAGDRADAARGRRGARPTSTGTGSPRPTTSGSTCARCATSSTRGTGSSACR